MSSFGPKSDKSDRGADRGSSDKEFGGLRRSRRRGCPFCGDTTSAIDYKDPGMLRYFVTDRGKIVPRRISGVCSKHQREVTTAIKRARNIALLSFTTNH